MATEVDLTYLGRLFINQLWSSLTSDSSDSVAHSSDTAIAAAPATPTVPHRPRDSEDTCEHLEKGDRLLFDADIDKMFDYITVSEKNKPKEKVPITDFYTIAEIKEKYGVKASWIYEIAKEHNIPRTFNRGRTYWSKKHIDSYFAKKAPDASITEWYSVAELQEKFGMTLSAIYTFFYKNVIPKRKEGKMVYYSKKHFDIAKGIATPEEPQYYTIPEAMEKYNLTRDQLYHYVKYHNITRIKVGKYTKILRSELDKFFEPPKIE